MTIIKTKKEIEILKEAGRMLAEIMEKLKKEARAGITTNYLNNFAEQLIFEYGCTPAFKGYQGYPYTLCTSVNEVIVHGTPSNYKLKNGDILSLDCGLKYKGFYSDMAITIGVGNISEEVNRLIKTTKKALKRGIKKAKPGNTIGDIGNTIQRYVESQGFNVIRDLCGHGIGKELHEDPQILNYGKRHTGEKIKPGMVFCIEPMVSAGSWKIKRAEDGYGFKTKDNSLSAHFEHMIAVIENGPKVLTKL